MITRKLTIAFLCGSLIAAPTGLPAAAQARTGGHASPAGTQAAALLRLQVGSLDPAVQKPRAALAGRPAAWRDAESSDDLFILQFAAAPRQGWLDGVRSTGAVLFGYVPDHAFLARVPAAAQASLRSAAGVRALVPYLPGLRVSPALMAADPAAGDPSLSLIVEIAPDADPRQALSALRSAAAGLDVIAAGGHSGALIFRVGGPLSTLAPALPRLARTRDLLWIEREEPAHLLNRYTKGMMQTGVVDNTRLFDAGLTGSGQILAIADSGVDVNHCFFTDPLESVTTELIDAAAPPAVPATNPSHRKILAYQYHSGSDTGDGDGHGTHVSGTAVGDDLAHLAIGGDPGLDEIDGMAPGASLVFQDIDATGGFLDLPSNLAGYLTAAYNAGARIHSNSWGTSSSSYTSQARAMDLVTWEHPDMLFLVAMGNDGPADGTIGAPATAKNIVAVGMTVSASGNANNLDSGSSNGPTSDGRLKPDVVNPGGYPIRSAGVGTACGFADYGGTSMATPGVAGGAALVRQWLADGFYPHGYAGSGPAIMPSAALVKGLLVNSAINISGANVDAPIPDNSQGWGRVLLDNALFLVGDDSRLEILHDDDLASAADGFAVGSTATDSYTVHRCRTDIPLKVTLVWSEPPVAATSGQAWVNDLDLEVEAPGGTVYLGNDFAGGVSTTGGSADDRNNVEQVLIPAGTGPSGVWTVRVAAAAVNQGPQPYALLATGDVSAAAAPALTASGPVVSGGNDGDGFLDQNETVTMTWTVENTGCGDASGLSATLSADSTLPVSITPATLTPADLPASISTQVAFQVGLGAAPGVCGGELPLLLAVDDGAGRRWQGAATALLDLDPGAGTRQQLDDVEGGDLSASAGPSWSIQGCQTASGSASWHLGDADCSGIPKDAGSHNLAFDLNPVAGEQMSSVSFVHAFDGYSNATYTDSVQIEIDHDRDGSFNTLASWSDAVAPKTMTAAGPFDLTPYNSGRAVNPRIRFRFKSGASWVGGPNNAAGWNVDDILVSYDVSGVCETCADPPPGDVGDTLAVTGAAGGADLAWGAVTGAASYQVRRSGAADMSGAVLFGVAGTSWNDPGLPAPDSIFFYRAFALNSCGGASEH